MKPTIKALAAGAILIVVFAVSFLVFYKRAQKNTAKQPLILTSAVINQPLPKANLVDIAGQRFDDAKLRHGKIILAFMMPDCQPCDQENEFLKSVIGNRKDVSFIFVLPLGNKDEVLKLAHDKYASEPFFDEGTMLSRKLEMYQVPIKVFLEDGIIKRTWLDATVTPQKQDEFKDWLNNL